MYEESGSPQKTKRFARINRYTALFGCLLIGGGLLLLRTEFAVRGTGVVELAGATDFFAPADGFVRVIKHKAGDRIRQGEVILRLHNPELDSRVVEAERDLARLEGDLLRAQAKIDDLRHRPVPIEFLEAAAKEPILQSIEATREALVRQLEPLAEQRDISSVDLANRRIEELRARMERVSAEHRAEWMRSGLPDWEQALAVAETEAIRLERDAARRILESLRARIDALVLRAPFDGTLIDLVPEQVGEAKRNGQFLFQVAESTSDYEVEAQLPQRNADLLQVGQFVRMESRVFRSITEGHIEGSVLHLRPAAKPSNTLETPTGDSVAVEAQIRIDRSPWPLIPGSSVEVEVIVGHRSILEMLLLRRKQAWRAQPEAKTSTSTAGSASSH